MLHLEKPSLPAILGLILSMWIFEQLLVLQESIEQRSVGVYPRSRESERLIRLAKRRNPRHVDLIQVSGQTILPFLVYLSERRPGVTVRILLVDDAIAAKIDTDGTFDHVGRIQQTVAMLANQEAANSEFSVQLGRYNTWPALCAVLFDSDVVSVSWCPTYRDADKLDVIRIRGHMSPVVTATGRSAEPLIEYVRGFFDKLWAARSVGTDRR